MTTTKPTTHTTITDKVQLFRENGIDASDYFDGREDDAKFHIIRFEGNRSVADRVVEIAIQHGLDFIEVAHVWSYSEQQLQGPPCWHIVVHR